MLKTTIPSYKSLVAYWTLNESDALSTAIYDKSGNNNTGTSANTPVFTKDQNGVVNQSMVFNGTTDLINAGSDSSIDNIFDGGGTASAWIKADSDGESSAGRMFSKRTGWNFNIQGESAGKVKVNFKQDFDTDGEWLTVSTEVAIGEWTHISVTYNNDNVVNNPIIYINGIAVTLLEDTAPTGTRVSDASSVLYLGNTLGTTYTFDGSLSDLALFNEILTEDEVRQLYLAGRTSARVKVDATNPDKYSIGSLQKGLILDMPLGGAYTEAGGELNPSLDFTSWSAQAGWSISDGIATHTAGADGNQVYKALLTTGKKYIITYTISSISGGSINSYYGSSGTSRTTAGTYIETFTAGQAGLGLLAQAATDAVITEISCKELDGTTLDRTPYSNDGTVSGATKESDGLVNTTAGTASIPSESAYGEWIFDLFKGGSSTITQFIGNTITSFATNQGYMFYFSGGEGCALFKMDGAGNNTELLQTATSYISNSTWYRIKITRSLAGVFTVYIKGGSFGWSDWTLVDVSGGSGTNPVTDNTYTTSAYFVADLDAGDKVKGLKINGKKRDLSKATQSTGAWTVTGDSYDFNGTSDYINIDGVVSDLTSETKGTISVWVKTDNAASTGEIVSFGDTNADTRIQFDNNNGVLRALVGETGTTQWALDTDNTVFVNDTWIHIVLTQDGIEPILYVNGIVVNQAFSTSTNKTYWFNNLAGLDNCRIGCANWNNGGNATFFNGQIDGLKIYNRAISTEEVKLLFDKGN